MNAGRLRRSLLGIQLGCIVQAGALAASFRRRAHRICAAVLALSLCAPVLANYSCTGTVDGVTVAPGTGVVIFSSSAGLSSVYLCQLEASTTSANGTVTPEQCKAMLSVLLGAQLSRQAVQLSFSDSLTCTTHPAWAWLTGWYYGPALSAN